VAERSEEARHHITRHCQGEPTRDHRIDANHAAACVGEGATRVPRRQPEIGLDEARACRAAGSERVDHPRRHRAGQSERVADGDHQVAHAQGVGITNVGSGQAIRIN